MLVIILLKNSYNHKKWKHFFFSLDVLFYNNTLYNLQLSEITMNYISSYYQQGIVI